MCKNRGESVDILLYIAMWLMNCGHLNFIWSTLGDASEIWGQSLFALWGQFGARGITIA